MTPDEFARAAYPLLHEGIVLLRAHAGEGPAIERYVAVVEAVRAQYRAAKEAPAPATDVIPTGYRLGAGWEVSKSGSYSKTTNDLADVISQGFPLDEYVRIGALEPIPAPAPEPSAPPAGVPVCKGGRGKCGSRVEDLGGPALWGFELEGLWFCSQECRTEHIKATNPPPSDPVTVATGGVPSGFRLGDGWTSPAPSFWSCTNGVVTGPSNLTGSGCGDDAEYAHLNDPGDADKGGPGACEFHAIEMGALVPIDTARSVPPGPVLPEGEPVLFTCPHGLTRSEPGCGAMCNLKPGSLWTGPHSDASDVSVKVDPGVTADDVRAAVAAQADRVSAFSGKPPGPVSVEAPPVCKPDCGTAQWVTPGAPAIVTMWWCSDACGKAGRPLYPAPAPDRAPPPAAPASEPAVRPLREAVAYTCCSGVNGDHEVFCSSLSAEVLRAFQQSTRVAMQRAGAPVVRKVAALEAELAEEKRAHALEKSEREYVWEREGKRIKERNAARAEVEQLKASLVDAYDSRAVAWRKRDTFNLRWLKEQRDSTDRVRSMREAAAKVADDAADGCQGVAKSACRQVARVIEHLPLDTDAPPAPMSPCYYGGHWCEHTRTQDLGIALVCLDCGKQQGAGTAPDPRGEVSTGDVLAAVSRANLAVKAAVDKANNRAADAFREWWPGYSSMWRLTPGQFEAWLRSGEDAPGAVTPAKGGE